MKTSKKFIVFCLSVVLIFATFLTGCTLKVQNDGKSIVSITKTAEDGLVDTYTILFTDGTKTTFTVTNGSNGGADNESGNEFTLDGIYQKWLDENPNGDYNTFLKEVLNVESGDNSLVVNKALLSSLKVYTEFTTTLQVSKYQTKNSINMGAGSAVIYKITDDYTYLITNYHVVYNKEQNKDSKIATKITCYLYGSENVPSETKQTDEEGYQIYDYGFGAIDCEYVGGSATADIALLKTKTEIIKAINPDVCEVEFAEDYHVGETAIAIGNPDDDGISVTQGIISVDNEFISLSIDGELRSYRSMRIDTPLYPGNSGGGLFNMYGKLIGITNAGNTSDQNINYAVPLDIVKPVVENIYHYANGYVNKITLGVTVERGDSKYVYDKETGYGKVVSDVNVKEIVENSLASYLGLQVGDRISIFKVNTNEYELEQFFSIGDILYGVRAGDVISFKLIRDGSEKTTKEYTVMPKDIKIID